MKYKYYVVYTCNYHSTHNTIGAVEITTDTELNTMESINNVRKYITENYCDGYGCIIVNFIKLEEANI
jgi:hypothetical protein